LLDHLSLYQLTIDRKTPFWGVAGRLASLVVPNFRIEAALIIDIDDDRDDL